MAVLLSFAAPATAQFALCAADSVCAVRWGLGAGDEDFARERFDEMLAVWETRDGFSLTPILPGATNATADIDPALAYALLVMMRTAHVCEDNQEWVPGHGCVCSEGKHCGIDCTEVVISDLWSIAVAVGVSSVVGLFLVIWITQQDSALAHQLEEKFSSASVSYYTAQAQLWASDISQKIASGSAARRPVAPTTNAMHL